MDEPRKRKRELSLNRTTLRELNSVGAGWVRGGNGTVVDPSITDCDTCLPPPSDDCPTHQESICVCH
jgi:hypothetical protein